MDAIINFFKMIWSMITDKNFDKPGPSSTQVEDPAPVLPDPELDRVGLMSDAPPMVPYPHLPMAIMITGSFEGSGYGQVTGDFDGQGMSVGVLQWNFGQGTLQRTILDRYWQRHGSIDALRIFPSPGLDSLRGSSIRASLTYVRNHMLSSKSVKRDWRAAWQKFLLLPEVKQLQLEGCYGVAAQAQKIMNSWHMDGERAFCFFFDIVTQNGTMKDVVKPMANIHTAKTYASRASKTNKAIWLKYLETAHPTADQLILFCAGYQRAIRSRAAYVQDVFSRKGSIALGKGLVHGKSVDLFS